MRAIGFNQGQIGDLALNMIACRSFKELYPNSHLTFSINKKYASASKIFLHNPLVQDIKIWDGYDNWPTENDSLWITNNKFDKFFHPCPKVTDPDWYMYRHHSEEVCRMHNLPAPKNLKVELVRYFDLINKYDNYVALTPFSSAGSARDIPYEMCIRIIEYIHSLGFKTIQLGGLNHIPLPTSNPIIGGDIFDDVKVALSCKMLITADTGMNYLMSGYEQKVLGLYCTSCYRLQHSIINRAPVNKNATYLSSFEIKDISLESIKKSINSLL